MEEAEPVLFGSRFSASNQEDLLRLIAWSGTTTVGWAVDLSGFGNVCN